MAKVREITRPMSAIAERLSAQLQAITNEYDAHFANKARATRELDRLDALIDGVQSVVAQLTASGGDEADRTALAPVAETAEKNLALYREEREAIVQAKNRDPGFDKFGELATLANLMFAQFQRHFAGQNRATRDPALLADLIEQLQTIHKEMLGSVPKGRASEVTSDIQVVSKALASFRTELSEIEKAQVGEGGPPDRYAADDQRSRSWTNDEQINVLAVIANAQFEVYRVHFAGKSRTSRRPALLERVVKSLKRIHHRMSQLQAQGKGDATNVSNIDIVASRLSTYETELNEVRAARKGESLPNIQLLLGGEANALFEAYRDGYAGKDRGSVDFDELGRICDQLQEIRRQMAELGRFAPTETNTQNMGIVIEQLVSFEGEYDAVKQSQAAATIH